MSASSIKCSACSNDVIASEKPFVCVEVKERSCITVALETVNEDTAEMICLVHEECLNRFEEMVATGMYSALNSN